MSTKREEQKYCNVHSTSSVYTQYSRIEFEPFHFDRSRTFRVAVWARPENYFLHQFNYFCVMPMLSRWHFPSTFDTMFIVNPAQCIGTGHTGCKLQTFSQFLFCFLFVWGRKSNSWLYASDMNHDLFPTFFDCKLFMSRICLFLFIWIFIPYSDSQSLCERIDIDWSGVLLGHRALFHPNLTLPDKTVLKTVNRKEKSIIGE